MIPIFDRSHIFSFRKEPDEVGLVVESAVIAYFGCAQVCVCKQVAGFCHPEVVDVGDEGDACLLLEEMAECGIGHVYKSGCIG